MKTISSTINTKTRKGFTLIELLVVIAIIAILAAMLLPALAKAKSSALTAKCRTNMKNWALSTSMYESDYSDLFPYFGYRNVTSPYTGPEIGMQWPQLLGPYVAAQMQIGTAFNAADIYTNQVRMCPGGSVGPPPYSSSTTALIPGTGNWNCWIGANFGHNQYAPFFYEDPASGGPPEVPAMKASSVLRPSKLMIFMDTVSDLVYNPVDPSYPWKTDADGDGKNDSNSLSPAFNGGRPTVHNNAANLAMMDGHLETVPYKILWQLDSTNAPACPYWYMDGSH